MHNHDCRIDLTKYFFFFNFDPLYYIPMLTIKTLSPLHNFLYKISYNGAVNYCTVENRSRITPSIWTTLLILKQIWYCNHSIMVLRPLKYGVTTNLIFNFSKYQYGISTTQICYYDHSNI